MRAILSLIFPTGMNALKWINKCVGGPIILAGILYYSPLVAQSGKSLENKRKNLLSEINRTTELLQNTQKSRETTLIQFVSLQSQVDSRQELIETLRQEIVQIHTSIYRTEEVICALEEDDRRLKGEYSQAMRLAYRHLSERSLAVFLFSSSSFNNAVHRWLYIRQYHRYRRKQAVLIAETSNTLQNKLLQLDAKKIQIEDLLGVEQAQKSLMSLELAAKNNLLQKLKKEEATLAKKLTGQQKAHKELNAAIEKVIKQELERASYVERKANRKPEETISASFVPTSPESMLFIRERGKLAWPVKKGRVIRYFGRQPHPSLPSVQISNNGIDIQAQADLAVMCLFKGKVLSTPFIPGYKNAVIVQHGQHYTVYANLEDILVKRGDIIDKGTTVGRLSPGPNSEIHLEIWQGKEKLNPIDWLLPEGLKN